MTSPKRLAATGGAGPAIYVDDVFSTWLYTGNGSTQTINNGIDLLGKGGMVWVKQRNGTYPHILSNTVRGLEKALVSNSTAAEDAITNGVTFPNGSTSSTGFVLGSNTESNQSGQTFGSWTFREAEKFFGVVTYTGNGSNRTIAHNLGSVPGCIIVKRTDTTSNWQVYHRSLTSAANSIQLNLTNAQASATTVWNSTAPTSTVFSVGADASVNASGGTYVAYLFAHDAGGFGATGNDNVISCGSYTGNASSNGPVINLGYEPQWLLIKNSGASQDWIIVDVMRGIPVGGEINVLFPNLSSAETVTSQGGIALGPTSFQIRNTTSLLNSNGVTYIYIAIRRPMKPPTSGTQVFGLNARTGTGANATVTGSAGVTDLGIVKNRGSANWVWASRLTGTGYLSSNATSSEVSAATTILQSNPWDVMDGIKVGTTSILTNASGNTFVNYLMRRAPGFFDVVCYAGNGVNNRTIDHNLAVSPELTIIKLRSGDVTRGWRTYTPGAIGSAKWGLLDSTNAFETTAYIPSVSSTTITLSNDAEVNRNACNYVAYLFASLPGISQVGSYTGNGSSQTINCGFAAGARFVLIRRTDSTGNWVTFDTARGIVSGNDPALYPNSTAAEVTGIDGVDPDSSGFIVNQESTFNLNVNGASYIYLSVA